LGWVLKKGRAWDGWEDYLEGRERIDLIKTAQPHWMNVNVSDTGRLDEFFDPAGLMTPGICVRPNRVATATDCSGQKRIHRIYEIGAPSLNQ
jgi:hypothetical protein